MQEWNKEKEKFWKKNKEENGKSKENYSNVLD